jgi:hypothetical protein
MRAVLIALLSACAGPDLSQPTFECDGDWYGAIPVDATSYRCDLGCKSGWDTDHPIGACGDCGFISSYDGEATCCRPTLDGRIVEVFFLRTCDE